MAHIINLKTFTDQRGNLTVIERVIPFEIRRIFYIYGVDDSIRGGHRHHKTIQAAICIQGNCVVFNDNGETTEEFVLDTPSRCLIIESKDWHQIYDFSEDAILMVLASELYDEKDYIFDRYVR